MKSATVRLHELNDTSDTGRLYAVPALEKGLDVLEYLACQEQPSSLTGIAQGLDRSPGELFRLLSVLQRRGWITKLPDDRYQLSTRLFELAHGFAPRKRLVDVALPIMRTLARDLRQSCHLSVPEEGEQLVVLEVESPGPAGLFVRAGTRYPLGTTASGRVFLAFGIEPHANQRPLSPEGAERARPRDLDERLKRIRKRGYEEVAGEWLEAVVDLSWPIFDVRGEIVAALAVPFLAMGQPRQAIAPARVRLHMAATEISEALGSGDYGALLAEARNQR